MLFNFILIIAFIGMCIKLGMYSVWYTVLSAIVKVMVLIIIALLIPIFWGKIFSNESRLSNLH